jgi:hypothetical protein
MDRMTSPLESISETINPYASPLAEDAVVARERTRWRIVAVVVAAVCAVAVGIGTYILMGMFGVGFKILGPTAGLGPIHSLHLVIAAVFAFAAFVLSIGRSRRAWEHYEGLLQRKRLMLEEARERRDAKNAPPPSPFADPPK